jgi:hypothetical protein
MELTEISINSVILAWLQGETKRISEYNQKFNLDLLNGPDLNSAEENQARYNLLVQGIRYGIFKRLPPDTKWYICEGSLLKDKISPVEPWINPIRQETIPGKLVCLDNIIFWGHDLNKLIVLEGNHRWAQWETNGFPETKFKAFVGLSSSISRWMDWPKDQEYTWLI